MGMGKRCEAGMKKMGLVSILLICALCGMQNHTVKQWLLAPVVGARLSSVFGNRFHPILKRNLPHNGVDLAAPVGVAIRSIGIGRVIFSGNAGRYGKMVVIQHANGLTSHYAHCSSIIVSPGDKLARGQLIGAIGKTGQVTGPHLHFELRSRGIPLDPIPLVPLTNQGHSDG